MPSLTFVLPHWLYWSGLVLIPALALYTVRRQKAAGVSARGVSLPISYLLWLTGGFVGLHRFYLRNLWGWIYLPFFSAILFGNVEGRAARNAVSRAHNALLGAKFDLEQAQAAAAKGAEGAAAKVEQARQALSVVQEKLAVSSADLEFWLTFSGGFALLIALLLLFDAFVLPGLTRRCAEREAAAAEGKGDQTSQHMREVERVDDGPGNAFTAAIDRLNGWVGHFICYWSVIAVFVYYYEVLARYVFNSPTNWAHEGMFLLFGMQYLISGGFALREDSHVRVDVIYLHLPRRGQAIVDIITSLFFFIFTGALFWTGFVFMVDSVSVWEVSFTEWAIQYWPVKSTLAVGALLLLLQGISKLTKDILILTGGEA